MGVKNRDASTGRGDEIARLDGRVGRIVTLPDFIAHAVRQRCCQRTKLAVDATEADAFLLPEHRDAGDRERDQQGHGVRDRQPGTHRESQRHDGGANS